MRLRFDGFELDREGCQLYRAGAPVPLERRALDLLLYFVDRPEQLIARQELVQNVWHARALSEGVLASTVAKLRKAIGQASDAREPLETVRGRGYRWNARGRAHGPQPVAAPDDPFLARAAPLSQLSEALARAAAATGQLWLVTGDAGMGKTRLMRELEQHALRLGFSVWWGAGYDGAVAPAYWPWVEVLRSAHLQLTAAGFLGHLPARRPALEQLVPELCGSAGQPAVPQTQRFALLDELSCFLESASRPLPRLILIDDLHWADEATFELLGYAARALARSRILFVAALRDSELSVSAAAPEALRRLQRTAASIALSGLTCAEVSELIARHMPERAHDAAFGKALFERTQGNPLFVRETLRLLRQQLLAQSPPQREVSAGARAQTHSLRQGFRALREDADISQLAQQLTRYTKDGAVAASEPSQPLPPELPPAVRSVIEQRIALLSEATRRVLAAAAVSGADFDANTLAELLGLSLEAVVHALDSALQLRVLEQRAAAHAFAFTHALLRDALYTTLPSSESGRLHGRLAEILVARGAAADARQLALITHHFLLAIPSQLAASVQHGCAAAAATRASAGFEAAAAILSRVVHKHERESDDLLERCQLLLSLGSDLNYAGNMPAAWQVLRRGAQLVSQLEAAELQARFAIALAPWLEVGGGDEAYVRALLARAHAAVSEPELRARLLAKRAQLEGARELRERDRWLDEAQALAEAPELSRELAYARVVMHAPPSPSQSRQDILRFQKLDAADGIRALEPTRLQQSFSVELTAYTNALAQADLQASAASLERCRVLARDAHIMGLDFMLDMVDAGRALAAGRLSELESCIVRLGEASAGGGGFSLAWMRYGLLLAYERGQLRVLLDVPAEQFPQLSQLPSHGRIQGELTLAWAYAKTDAPNKARRQLADIAADTIERLPLQRDDLGPMCMLAEIYQQLGDRAGAERLLAQLAPFAELNAIGPTYHSQGAVAHFMAQLAALLGRRAEAARHFDCALELNARLHMPLQLARTRSERDRLLA